jgi:DNA (cytosine-5)-methyltransferase 1
MGYAQAGFDMIGIDHEPQPNYPFEFYQYDLTQLDPEWIIDVADVVVASPPCWFHTALNKGRDHGHIDLIPETRELIEATRLPYVIENVEGARDHLINPLTLCGSSFGLRVRRHRLFEANFRLTGPACDHEWQDDTPRYRIHVNSKHKDFETGYLSGIVPVYGGSQTRGGPPGSAGLRAAVGMGIDWMSQKELNQAIPPAYTHHLGRQLMAELDWRRASEA